MTMTTDNLNGIIIVRDSDGGIWWPSDEVRAEIEASPDPEVTALMIAEDHPTRGTWKQ